MYLLLLASYLLFISALLMICLTILASLLLMAFPGVPVVSYAAVVPVVAVFLTAIVLSQGP